MCLASAAVGTRTVPKGPEAPAGPQVSPRLPSPAPAAGGGSPKAGARLCRGASSSVRGAIDSRGKFDLLNNRFSFPALLPGWGIADPP